MAFGSKGCNMSPGSHSYSVQNHCCGSSEKKESEVAQLCPTLCNPVDYSPSGFSVLGRLQARILEWVTISFSRGSSRPRDWTQVSRIGGKCFNLWATRVPVKWAPKGQLPPISCDKAPTKNLSWAGGCKLGTPGLNFWGSSFFLFHWGCSFFQETQVYYLQGTTQSHPVPREGRRQPPDSRLGLCFRSRSSSTMNLLPSLGDSCLSVQFIYKGGRLELLVATGSFPWMDSPCQPKPSVLWQGPQRFCL